MKTTTTKKDGAWGEVVGGILFKLCHEKNTAYSYKKKYLKKKEANIVAPLYALFMRKPDLQNGIKTVLVSLAEQCWSVCGQWHSAAPEHCVVLGRRGRTKTIWKNKTQGQGFQIPSCPCCQTMSITKNLNLRFGDGSALDHFGHFRTTPPPSHLPAPPNNHSSAAPLLTIRRVNATDSH